MTPETPNPWPAAYAAVAMAQGSSRSELSADDVIAHLQRAGVPASKTALASAHRAGLVPTPRVAHLGRGKGTESHYPIRTVGQYACYQAALKVHRNKDDAGWRLWCLGADVPEKYWRPRLERAAAGIDFVRSVALSIIERQEGDDHAAEYAARKIARLSRTMFKARIRYPVLRRVRKELGPERLNLLIGHVTAILTGHFQNFSTKPEGDDPDRRSGNMLMDVAFAMGPARTDYLPNAGPWLDGDIAPILAKLGTGLGRGSAVRLLENSMGGELVTARVELADLLAAVHAFARAAELNYGKDAFGLRRVREFIASLTPDLEAVLLVMWLMVRPEFSGDAQRFIATIRDAIIGATAGTGNEIASQPPRLRRRVDAYPAV